ncbi:MAG: ABC transporter substrate-binding protein [Candidatus Thiodiazotropha sp.]
MSRVSTTTTLAQVLYLAIMACSLLFAPLLHAKSSTLQPVTLQLSWHHQYQFAGYYLAEILGYYEQENLRVNILAGRPQLSPLDEVLSGRAEFGIGNSDLMLHFAEGEPVLALAAISQHAPTVLIALKSSGIHHITDLKGKRVMLQPGYGSLSLLAMLKQTGLMEQITRLDSSMNINDLVEGHTDLFNGYASNEPYLLEERGIDYTLFNPYDYGIQFYSDVLFTRQDLNRSEPKMVAAFRRASLKGWRYAMDNPEKSINLITQFYLIEKTKPWLRFEANKLREMVVPDLVEIGHMSTLRWEKIAEQLQLMGLMQGGVDLEAFSKASAQQPLIDWEAIAPYVISVLIVLTAAVATVILLIKLNRNLRKEVDTRIQAEHQATYLATHDPLTGLSNRILFMDRLENTLQRARREGNSPGLLFIDLDNFKIINDTYGHYKGDEALKRVADSVTSIIRESDTFARLGGDEFTLLIEHCEEHTFQLLAQKILNTIQDALSDMHTDIDLGASVGLLVIDDPMSDAESILSRADHLMYQAKFNGKNHIESGQS